MRKGSGLSGGDLDKDTLAFGAKGRWETWQDRGINRDANVHGTRSPLRILGGWGGWGEGGLGTNRASEDWGAP